MPMKAYAPGLACSMKAKSSEVIAGSCLSTLSSPTTLAITLRAKSASAGVLMVGG